MPVTSERLFFSECQQLTRVVLQTLPLASLHDKVSFSQKHLSFYGFIFPVMVRAKCFHQYLLSLTLQLEASEASSPTANNGTCAHQIVFVRGPEYVLWWPRSYGCQFLVTRCCQWPLCADCRRLAVSTMIRRMPLESFLRLVRCDSALASLVAGAVGGSSQQPTWSFTFGFILK